MLFVVARSASSRPKLVVLLALIVVLGAGAYGSSALSKLSSGGFTDPSSPSTKADALLATRFHQGDANLVFLVEAPTAARAGDANARAGDAGAVAVGRAGGARAASALIARSSWEEAYRQLEGAGGARAASAPIARGPAASVGLALARSLARSPDVANVQSYWTAAPGEQAGFASSDGRYGLVTAHVLGNDSAAVKRAGNLAARFDGAREGVRVLAGGLAATNYEIDKQVSRDLDLAEAVAVPLTFVALIFVFGGLVAALLPLAVGLIAILCTLAVLRLLTSFIPVSVYAVNLTTALGLGLAIDYSLFIVSRYREELGRHGEVHEAVQAAVVSAGRTVLFSSSTVGLSMVAMAVFPFYFLRSFAYAGLAVVAVAALGAVVVLPAALTLVGRRVNAWDLRPIVGRFGAHVGHGGRAKRLEAGRAGPARDEGSEDGFWHRLAEAVMRRPLTFGLPVLAFLLLLGLPFLSVRFGFPDDRVLPASATAHQVGNVLRADFRQDSADQLTIVLPDVQAAHPGQLASYASRLSQVAGVKAVESPKGTFARGLRVAASRATRVVGGSAYFVLENNVNPYSGAGEKLVHELRAVPSPARALLTGLAARNVDALNALEGLLPLALGLVGLSSLVALYAFTRSVIVPLKALVLNTLSLSATFGAMVWVFQDGHLGWLFGDVGATGYLTATMPVLMFCIAFGLSMDYEVFLVSRIKEEWDRSARTAEANRRAVATGLQRTGPIVTAAAALVSIVFISVATSQVSFIKLFGVGMALAVLVDATLVRGVLVPAFMRLAGRANWWAPRWLPSFGVASPRGQRGTPEEETAVRGSSLDAPPA